MKRIFKYLKGTTNIELVYHGNTSCAFVGYSYSDYAIYLDARRYMTRYRFTIDNSLVS